MSQLLLPGHEIDQRPAPAAAGQAEAQRPSLWLEYDPVSQSVEVQVNPHKIKTWDFARALCVMAQQACERMAEIQMARQAQQAIQANALAQQVMNDLPRRRR